MVRICTLLSSNNRRFRKARKNRDMKIVDEFNTINNKQIKKIIKESAELIRDIVHMQHDLVDDYAQYRILKAIDKIETFNKEIKQKEWSQEQKKQ